MKSLVVLRQENPRSLLESLLAAAQWPVLLLGPGQSLKPGAEAVLEGEAGGAPRWVPAHPHPDLKLDAYGRWLQGSGKPPFAQGGPRDASAWGLLGSAKDFAEALARGLERTPAEADWQPAFLSELELLAARPLALKEAWIFQDSLVSLSEALDRESLRARAWSRLHGLGLAPAEVKAALDMGDVPWEWQRTAEALAEVPLPHLRGVRLAGQEAGDFVGALAKAVMDRAFELAHVQGWREKPAEVPGAAAVARGLRRVAVLYPAYGGSLNLARRSAEALERLGYEVVRVDPSRHEAEFKAVQDQGDEPLLAKLCRSLEQECLATLAGSGAQMLWVLAQAPLSIGALRSLRRQGHLTAYWFCEDYRVRPHWRELAPAVDAFFPLQGGPFTRALSVLGVPAFAPLPACAASEACSFSIPPESRRQLTFFGAPYANRLRFFEALADLPLELFGEHWDTTAGPVLRPLVRDASRLTEAQGFELFRHSALNLNLHSSPFFNGIDPQGDYVNPRTFEIAACGGFQLCDRRRDLGAAFEEGSEVEVFGSVAELREKIKRWLADPEGRRRVAEAGRRRVRAQHTYEHRLTTALRAMGIEPPNPAF